MCGNLIHFCFVKVLPIEDHNEESETGYIANMDWKPGRISFKQAGKAINKDLSSGPAP